MRKTRKTKTSKCKRRAADFKPLKLRELPDDARQFDASGFKGKRK